jgi:hypothetical protein
MGYTSSTPSIGVNKPEDILCAKDPIVFRKDASVFRGFCGIQNSTLCRWGEVSWENIILDFSGQMEDDWYDGPFWIVKPYARDPHLGVGIEAEPGVVVLWTTVDL